MLTLGGGEHLLDHEKLYAHISAAFAVVTDPFAPTSLNLSIINISLLLARECSYLRALQHDHSFQQKELFVYFLQRH